MGSKNAMHMIVVFFFILEIAPFWSKHINNQSLISTYYAGLSTHKQSISGRKSIIPAFLEFKSLMLFFSRWTFFFYILEFTAKFVLFLAIYSGGGLFVENFI